MKIIRHLSYIALLSLGILFLYYGPGQALPWPQYIP